MNRFYLIAGIAVISICLGCEPIEERCAFTPDVSGIELEVSIESYESILPGITTKAELVDFFSANADLRDLFFNRSAYPSDSAFINELFHRFTSPHIDTLLQATQQVFGDKAGLKEQLHTAFSNMKYYYPEFTVPKIKTIITGMETDILVSDTLVIIGLDHYLGPDSKYKLINMYEYMARRYQKNFIVPSMMLLYGIDERYNKIDPTDQTALADMIAYGKAYHFAKQMLPCVPDSVFIGYTSQEIQGAKQNEDLIWKRFVEDQVFFSTSHIIKQRYLSERPRTLEVGEKCPGRIGTWVGWQVVKKYAEAHPDVTLVQLMETLSAQEIFKSSGYRPL
jgi:hypothetical protein